MLFIECDANETRYDYNLTIMESPKLAPDNRFKKINPVEIFRCRESIQDVEIKQCGICAALWWPF